MRTVQERLTRLPACLPWSKSHIADGTFECVGSCAGRRVRYASAFCCGGSSQSARADSVAAVSYLFVGSDRRSGGCRSVVLCTGYLGEQIESTFGKNYGPLRLIYSREREPLGTAGALKLAITRFESDPV